VVLALWATAAGARDAAIPVTPLDPQYPLLVELQRRGELGDRLAPGIVALPSVDVDAGSAAARLWRAWQDDPIAPDGLGVGLQPRLTFIGLETDPEVQLRPLYADVRDGDAVDPLDRWRTQLVGRARFHEHVTAGVHFTFDSRGDNDPRNRTRTFRQLDASNNFDAAWLRAHFDGGALTLGRVPFAWGPERLGGLLVGGTGPAVDLVHGRLDFGPHVLQSFAGQLSNEIIDDTGYRRWLYGHRFDLFFLEDRLRLSLSETALVAGPSESLNLKYLNPIPLWAQIQVENDDTPRKAVNAINAIDGTLVWPLGPWTSRWSGSVAVDDVQIDPEGRERNPDQIGWTASLDLSRDEWLLGYEYRRIGTWMYLHYGDATSHRHFARPLGAPEGPDIDRHHMRADWRPVTSWHLFGSLERRRSGENGILTTEPKEGNVDLPFPRGTVEKRWIATLGATWHRPGTLKAALQAAFHAIEDRNNVAGDDVDVWEFRAVVDLVLPALRWRVGG
jgi:hypothetical protein